MINNDRRKFIFKSGALIASTALTACGGGGGATASGAAAAAPVGPVTSAPVTDDSPAGASQLAATAVNGTPVAGASFRLVGATTVKAAPFCLGYAFRKGDVPAGSTVTNATGTLQVTPKNTWPDGSLKFAILAGQADVTGGTDTVVALQTIPAPAAPAALQTAKLRATEIVAEIGCGAFGTASWSGADWDSPFQTWVAGNRMSSWIYRKPVGSDPHLVAWLEVRLWSSGAVEVLPWIENGYLRTPGPTNKSATYTFSLAKTQRVSVAIDLKHHQRTPLISGAALSYWLSIDPGVVALSDPAYLQASEMVPTYAANVAPGSARLIRQAKTFAPLQQGNFDYDSDSMPSPGYQSSIGLLPEHDVMFLVASQSDRVTTYGSVVRNGYGAGRYGIHYRDETTNRPPAFSAYPTLVFCDGPGFKDTGASTTSSYTPQPTGGTGPAWDTAHSPSVGYMAYLLTGRFYFKEEAQFAAIANHFNVTDWVRGGGVADYAPAAGFTGASGICVGAIQTRSAAWWFRSLTQALAITPDADDPLRGELLASVEANCRYFHKIYVAQPNNPFGMISGEGSYGNIRGKYTIPAWQQDFVTAAWGMALSLGLPLSGDGLKKMNEFFAWKAKSVVGRLGATDSWNYINAAPYTMPISSADRPDFFTGAGPWLDSFKTAYDVMAANYVVDYGVTLGTSDGTLGMGFPEPSQPSMWHNLQPAIAYAVRHNVDGAKAAYDRMHSASNWATIYDVFNVRPVWSVRPANMIDNTVSVIVPPVVAQPITGAPSWLAGAAVNQWIEIPGTAGAGGAAVDAFSGFAFDHVKNEIFIAAAGGHGDSSDNRVVSLLLMTDKPVWRQRCAPSSTVQENVAYYSDGKPTSRHTYSSSQFVPQVNRLMLFGVPVAYGSAYSFTAVSAFNPDTNTWDPAGSWPDVPLGSGAVSVRATGDVYTPAFAKWSPATKSWTQPAISRTADQVRWPIAHDSSRDQLFNLMWGDGQGYGAAVIAASRVALNSNAQSSVTFAPSPAVSQFALDAPTYAGMDYDAGTDNFLFYCGQNDGAGRVYVVKPNSTNVWNMSILPIVGGARPPATPGSGVNNRFRYVAALKGFVLLPSANSNLFFIRTA